MSSSKISDSLIEEVIGRIKEEYTLKGEKEVAELIGISPQNFSKKKGKKSVINDIFEWALVNDKDLNLLFKGKSREIVEVRSTRKIDTLKYEYIDHIRNWISKKLIEDPRNRNWFEVEFEKFFQDFKKWKDEQEGEQSEYEASKQANSGGKR